MPDAQHQLFHRDTAVIGRVSAAVFSFLCACYGVRHVDSFSIINTEQAIFRQFVAAAATDGRPQLAPSGELM